ncbi:MAG TPA: cysteine synthase A [Arcobacter sp.]|nr:cysteine synthase A [Arcobacter sp.]HIP55951.1 cysteine synthase A [Arcobacter sp.]
MNIAKNLNDLVGNTPIIQLNNINKNIYAKCEFMNPTSSVKDRLSMNMLDVALKNGTINKDTHIIEPTSGNTGVGLAAQCASRGMKLTLTMPDSMSQERRDLMSAFGASVVLTPAKLSMTGSINKALEMAKEEENAVVLDQFSNMSNPAIHETTTALEILNDMDEDVDILVVAVGTGGTISGTSKVLKQRLPNIKIVAVEPDDSAVLSGEEFGAHKIQGIGAGFIPKTMNTDIYDEIVRVTNDDAINTAKQIACSEGLLVGISSGANIWASNYISAKEENKDKKIVTILCDTGERYLSTGIFTKGK